MPTVLTLTPAVANVLTLSPLGSTLYPSATTYPSSATFPGGTTLILTPA